MRLEEWCQGQGFPPWCPSEKLPMVSRWAKVLVALVGTNKGYEWVVGQWWETMYSEDSSSKENLNLLLRLARVETNIDLKDRRAKVLEGRLQENKDVGGFHDNSWQQSVA